MEIKVIMKKPIDNDKFIKASKLMMQRLLKDNPKIFNEVCEKVNNEAISTSSK